MSLPLRASKRMNDEDAAFVGSVVEFDDGTVLIYYIDPSQYVEALKGNFDVPMTGYRNIDAAKAHGWVIEG